MKIGIFFLENSESEKTVERTVYFLTVLGGKEVVAQSVSCFTYYMARAKNHTVTDRLRKVSSYHQNIVIRFPTERQGTQHHC